MSFWGILHGFFLDSSWIILGFFLDSCVSHRGQGAFFHSSLANKIENSKGTIWRSWLVVTGMADWSPTMAKLASRNWHGRLVLCRFGYVFFNCLWIVSLLVERVYCAMWSLLVGCFIACGMVLLLVDRVMIVDRVYCAMWSLLLGCFIGCGMFLLLVDRVIACGKCLCRREERVCRREERGPASA